MKAVLQNCTLHVDNNTKCKNPCGITYMYLCIYDKKNTYSHVKIYAKHLGKTKRKLTKQVSHTKRRNNLTNR